MTENTKPTPAKDDDNAPAKSAPEKRYAAYDLSYGRYVGGVHDRKGDATKAAKGIEDAGRKAEVREV